MNIINENNDKCKRYLPHELKTRENAVKTYRNGNSIDYVCRKYHISRVSLYTKAILDILVVYIEL